MKKNPTHGEVLVQDIVFQYKIRRNGALTIGTESYPTLFIRRADEILGISCDSIKECMKKRTLQVPVDLISKLIDDNELVNKVKRLVKTS